MKKITNHKLLRNIFSLELPDLLDGFLLFIGLNFAAKVRRRMEHDRNPLFITVQDKYKVKEYAKSKGVKTPKLFLVTENPESIPFDQLPPNYFIKANHGWNMNIRCIDSELYLFGGGQHFADFSAPSVDSPRQREDRLTREQCISLCNNWLSQKHSLKEWAYQWITPKIIVEEVLTPIEGEELNDYRLYTFNGVVKAINIGSPTYRRNKENVFFKPDWRRVRLTKYKEKLPNLIPKKPHNLQEMIKVAQTLGKELDFVRVDLFNTSRGIVLGEMTVYPDAGHLGTPTGCPFFNLWLGAQWKINRINIINESV